MKSRGRLGNVGRIELLEFPMRTVLQPQEDRSMDAHFNEYLAAVAGMVDLYGEPQAEQAAGGEDESTVELGSACGAEERATSLIDR